MNKPKALKFLNVFLILAFLIAVLALIFYKFIPTALQGSEFLYAAHEIAGVSFIILGIIHFTLNFSWVKMMYFKKKKNKP
ncbi:MAG: hypothetical protein K9N07_00225 [Candidatus Cloacimonetes bacterium]|nr:hypothetical protein [Candidatus Cloacimonadota bacterium]